MITYRYVAWDSTGEAREGLAAAACEMDVLGWLREQGYTPVSVDAIATVVKKKWRPSIFERVRSSDLAAVFWQLTTTVEGGITIAEALDAIAEDIENVRLEKILRRLLTRIERGGTFSEGMAEFPKVFKQLPYALILAGETGGDIGTAFRRVAEYFTNCDRLARKIKKATAYPAFVIAFVVLVVVFIMTLVIPRFRDMFDQFGAGQLPAYTRAFMAVYDMLMHYSSYILGAALLAVLVTMLAYRYLLKVHYLFSKLVLSLPFFGKLLKHAFVATFCRTMAQLIRGGVSVLEVFDILCDMTSNDITKSVISRTKADIVGGSAIYLSMAATRFFPNIVIRMVRAGEDSGSLWTVLERTADYYEEKVDASLATMITLLEPLLIAIVGAIVLAVVLALYLPIFSMSDVRA